IMSGFEEELEEILEEVLDMKKKAPSPTPSRKSNTDKRSIISGFSQNKHTGGSLQESKVSLTYAPTTGDDGFHQPTQTIISPVVQVPSTIRSAQESVRRPKHFSVSPASCTPPKTSPVPERKTGEDGAKNDPSAAPLISDKDQTPDVPCDHLAVLAEDPGEYVENTDYSALNGFYTKGPHLPRNYSVNTQDSENYANAPLKCGNVHFVQTSEDIGNKHKKHYICVGSDTYLPSVSEFMANFWGMRNPKIVLTAMNTTKMWILTNGVDAGFPKLIGDAVREYNQEQENSHQAYSQMLNREEVRKRRPQVIGIVRKEALPFGVYFNNTEGVELHAKSNEQYDLNSDHTHFIITEEEEVSDPGAKALRWQLEDQFRKKYGKERKIQRLMSIDGEHSSAQKRTDDYSPQTLDHFIPVVALLVQGSPSCLDHVMYYIQNKMPVVVLKGSGGIADMFGYIYEELQEKAESDPDYEEHILKPELTKMIVRQFASYFEDNDIGKFAFRDRIIQCVKMSHEGEVSYMTVMNIKGIGGSVLKDLDKYFLIALLKSEKRDEVSMADQLQNDLQLTIDWNRPDIAWQIFQQDTTKVRIDKKMFEKALLRKDREEFIDLFLTQGIRVHKFLNHKKLKLIFEKAEDREFFYSVCIEGVLGLIVESDQTLGPKFLSEHLNRLIFKLSWLSDFIQPYELSACSTGVYSEDANTLWNRCDEPIAVGLVCSRIYKEMTKYHMEQYQRTELEERSKEFGEMAVGAMSICWRDCSVQAYHMLGRRLPDFNDKSVVEIAHDAGYINFLAHPCCQKWLTKKFFGNLHLKDLDWGLFRLPYWFKILISIVLIFPMYIWINFTPPSKKKDALGLDPDVPVDEEDEDDDEEEEIQGISNSLQDLRKKEQQPFGTMLKSALLKRKKDIPFYQKYYLLWTAPITKFWTTNATYFIFLALFSLATLWPTCGSRTLDAVRFKTVSLKWNYIDIGLIFIFLILLLFRILQLWQGASDYTQAREFNCYALIFFYYRLLGVYLPISPTLGPMLLRIKRMISHDFVAFVRMFMIFMIVGGVTIQAIIYPHWPFGIEMIRRIITRPIYAMFLTQVHDLEADPTCSHIYDQTLDYCHVGSNYSMSPQSYNDIKAIEKCPNPSFSGYVITLQYLLICKLILVTLLFAMFSLTIGKVDKVASEIWKFQRYALIADFIERLTLPPPFTPLNMLYIIVESFLKRFKSNCCEREKVKTQRSIRSGVKRSDSGDTVFWKKVAREYMTGEEAKLETKNQTNNMEDILLSLQEDLRRHRKGMKRLNDRMMEMENMMDSSRLYLEDIAHKQEKNDMMGITNLKGRFIHVAARQSPYPSTTIARFPVFDKYVLWEVQYDIYDPKTFTLEKSKFGEKDIAFVDEDIYEILKLKEQLKSEGSSQQLTIPEFNPRWNTVTSQKIKGKQELDVDRRSWIYVDNKPLRYTLDQLNIPLNPMGRTGMRGKGILWRWGPNHVIKAVFTRWRKKKSMDRSASSFMHVEGKRVLEFLTIQADGLTLPGVFPEGGSVARSDKFEQRDMIKFFSRYATSNSELSLGNLVTFTVGEITDDKEKQGYSAELLYKGYLDDPRNTDNAWGLCGKWKEISPSLTMSGNETVLVQEAARLHDAYH
ncbi:TMP2L-like protein, partial [Mya arenaria]